MRAGGIVRAAVLIGAVIGIILSRGAAAQQTEEDRAALEAAYEAAFQANLNDPADLDTTFEYAELAVKVGDVEGGISALERMLIYNPDLPRVRLELGVLYFRLGSYEIARSYLTRAVEGADVPEPVRARVAVYLEEIDDRLARHKFTGSVLGGYRYQSNANAGPSSPAVRVFGLPATLADRFTQKADSNGFLSGSLRHLYDFRTQGGEMWESNVRAYGSRQRDQEQLDLGLLELDTGPAGQFEAGPLGTFGYRPYLVGSVVTLEERRYLTTWGAGLTLKKAFAEWVRVDVDYEHRERTCQRQRHAARGRGAKRLRGPREGGRHRPVHADPRPSGRRQGGVGAGQPRGPRLAPGIDRGHALQELPGAGAGARPLDLVLLGPGVAPEVQRDRPRYRPRQQARRPRAPVPVRANGAPVALVQPGGHGPAHPGRFLAAQLFLHQHLPDHRPFVSLLTNILRRPNLEAKEMKRIKIGSPLMALVALALLAPGAAAQEREREIGVTSAVNPQASGTPPVSPRRILEIGTNVIQNERVVTTGRGQAHMLFHDGSALTVGLDSEVVLDTFVYDPDANTGELAFSATKGIFRLVGGRISKTSPVLFKTPAATIGIRGGIVIVRVFEDGRVRATFLFGIEMTVTNKRGTVTVRRPGFTIELAGPDQDPSDAPLFPTPSELLAAALDALEGSDLARARTATGEGPSAEDVETASTGVAGQGSDNDPDSVASEAGTDETTEATEMTETSTAASTTEPESSQLEGADLQALGEAGQTPIVEPASTVTALASGTIITTTAVIGAYVGRYKRSTTTTSSPAARPWGRSPSPAPRRRPPTSAWSPAPSSSTRVSCRRASPSAPASSWNGASGAPRPTWPRPRTASFTWRPGWRASSRPPPSSRSA